MAHLSDFTNKYQVSRTLKFKLIPIGRTEEFITRAQIIENDETRSNDYKVVKGFIDQCHKKFIDDVLSGIELDIDKVEKLYEIYIGNGDGAKRRKGIKDGQAALRKDISDIFEPKNKKKSGLFGKDFIENTLPSFLTKKEEKTLVLRFKGYSGYFTKFQETRKNLYAKEEKASAIPYRIVNENLMKFFDNHAVYVRNIKENLPCEIFEQIIRDFSDVLKTENLDQLFSLGNFTHTLRQADIDAYNAVIGGRTVAGEKKERKGLNQYINEHNQKCAKGERIPKLKPLFNQLLSDREKVSLTFEKFKSAPEVTEALKKAFEEVVIPKVRFISELINKIEDYDLNAIFLKMGSDLSLVSKRHFGDYSKIKDAICEKWEQEHPRKRTKPHTYQNKKDKYFKSLESVGIGVVNSLHIGEPLQQYFMTLGSTEAADGHQISLPEQINKAFAEFVAVFDGKETSTPDNLRTNVNVLKNLLELAKDFQRFVKPLTGNGDETERDENFYGDFLPAFEQLERTVNPLYNKVRNFVTQKPYSLDKIKINFENKTLLKGWDVNKEVDNKSIILRKGGLYYLGVLNSQSARSILGSLWPTEGECYEKMVYNYFPTSSKMIPHCAFVTAVRKHFESSSEDYTLFDKENFVSPLVITSDIDALHRAEKKKYNIDYLKKTGDQEGYNKAMADWEKFCVSFLKAYKKTSRWDISGIEKKIGTYSNINDFYKDVDNVCYDVAFENVSEKFIHQMVDEGVLYLFQIYSKDFSKSSKGRPNLHTIYWRMLFDDVNLRDVVYKLNGEAEVFFRKASIKCNRPTHLANVPIKNKSAYNERHKQFSTFSYDLYKDRRYTQNQYEFHVSVTLNFKQNKPTAFNGEVLRFLKKNGVRHVIGIDRGERNLLYLVMVDMDGNIKKQISLNEIAGNPQNPDFKQDFHAILQKREGDRKAARRSWSTIQNIKELKEGYMSLVVHEIVKLMLENDAVVVLENLNRSFMQIRGGIEKSVYQKFEKKLIDKLGYIVDKCKAPEEKGGALHAVQLADTFENFGKNKNSNVRQCGFVFYVPAWCTSKIDPATGFVSRLKCKYENIESSHDFFSRFDSIYYDVHQDYFVFETDYSKFKTSSCAGKQKWEICTFGDRIHSKRNSEGHYEQVNVKLTEAFKELFSAFGLDLAGDIKEQIIKQESKPFFEKLHRLLQLTLQMRNSDANNDYIISPIKNEKGVFFDSRSGENSMPKDADANGAYNIARKGLMVIEQINATEDINDKFSPEISNEKWLNFAQR